MVLWVLTGTFSPTVLIRLYYLSGCVTHLRIHLRIYRYNNLRDVKHYYTYWCLLILDSNMHFSHTVWIIFVSWLFIIHLEVVSYMKWPLSDCTDVGVMLCAVEWLYWCGCDVVCRWVTVLMWVWCCVSLSDCTDVGVMLCAVEWLYWCGWCCVPLSDCTDVGVMLCAVEWLYWCGWCCVPLSDCTDVGDVVCRW